jgi:hypothetical protein
MGRQLKSFLTIFIRVVLLDATFSACADTLYEINLMPAPAVYSDGMIDLFTDTSPINPLPYTRVFSPCRGKRENVVSYVAGRRSPSSVSSPVKDNDTLLN